MRSRYRVLSFIVLTGVVVLPGCATKKYVREQVETLNPRIGKVEDGVKENGERIDAVDRRAQQGITAAAAADQKATQAGQAAQTAQQAAQAADRKADTVNTAVVAANARITTVDNKFSLLNDNYTPTGSTEAVAFALNKADLSDQAKGTLDKVASDVSGMRTGYMIELQGFTDSTGSGPLNVSLSQRRADSVLRYLVTKNIPLYRIAIVGLGDSNPVADNKTKAGRDQNRRVEIRILRSASGRATN